MRKYFREIRNAGAERLSVKARRGGASLQARRTRNRSDVRESRGIFVNRQHIGNIWGGAPLIFGAPFFCAARGRGSEKPQRTPAPDIFPKAPRSLRRPRDCRKNSPEKNGTTCPLPPKKRPGAPKSAARRKSRERLRPSPARFGGHIYDFRRLVEIVADNQAALHIYNVLGYVGAQVRDAFEGF